MMLVKICSSHLGMCPEFEGRRIVHSSIKAPELGAAAQGWGDRRIWGISRDCPWRESQMLVVCVESQELAIF